MRIWSIRHLSLIHILYCEFGKSGRIGKERCVAAVWNPVECFEVEKRTVCRRTDNISWGKERHGMIIRDYLICLLQMYLLEDLEKNILPYRRERFWEKFLVYCIAALAMFGTNRLESSILNMVMIPVIYMIASMVVFRGNIWKKLVTVCCYYCLLYTSRCV